MNTNTTQQEILLMLNTSFSSRAWSSNNEREKGNPLTQKEKLIEACWNGMTPEMLPECFEDCYNTLITLWGITDANTFIDLEFGPYMQTKEKEYSLNPYSFMQVQGYN